MSAARQHPLEALDDYQSVSSYLDMGYAGALPRAYLAAPAWARLDEARAYLAAQPGGYALLVWDAYRTPATQRDAYERYVRQLMAERGLEWAEAYPLGVEFVRDPESVFPHGTGGTIDLTLARDGEPVPMGTGFDEFTPRSYRDWFRQHPPTTSADRQAHHHRELLRAAMESAGFVGIDSEWWHYEWGTRHWAQETGQDVVLDVVLPAPS